MRREGVEIVSSKFATEEYGGQNIHFPPILEEQNEAYYKSNKD